MTKIDFEILDVVSQYPIEINHILFGNKFVFVRSSEIFEYHSANDIYMSLYGLLCRDFICLKNCSVDKFSDFNDFLNHEFPVNCWIELSQKGGQAWEQEFKPNWYNYIEVCYCDISYTDPISIELTSMNHGLLTKICQELNQDKIIIKKLTEWDICYWKQVLDESIFKFSYTAHSIDEKILIDNIYHSLGSNYYKELFCKKSKYFF